MIERAPFGATGHDSSRAVFGAAALGKVSKGDADRALDTVRQSLASAVRDTGCSRTPSVEVNDSTAARSPSRSASRSSCTTWST